MDRTVLISRSRAWLRGASSLVVDFSAYCMVRLLVAMIQVMPLDMGDSMCRALAWFADRKLKIREKTTLSNLRRILPNQDDEHHERLSAAMWHHLLLMVCEIAWAQRRLHLTNWHHHVTFRDNKTLLGHMLSPRPIVMVTGPSRTRAGRGAETVHRVRRRLRSPPPRFVA